MSKVIKPPSQSRTADFRTLERESRFINPPKDKSAFPVLEEAVRPHIGSFNALTEGPDGGLLNLGVQDIGEKVIFDGKPFDSEDETANSSYLGNKLAFRQCGASLHCKAHVQRRCFFRSREKSLPK